MMENPEKLDKEVVETETAQSSVLDAVRELTKQMAQLVKEFRDLNQKYDIDRKKGRF